MPAEIVSHGGAHGALPLAAVIAEVCAFDGVEHIVRVVGFEGESVAARRTKVVDGVFKSAGFADDGYRAVTQRNHLGKTTWADSVCRKTLFFGKLN